MDPADFKAYIFQLLFFKWISDTWDWESKHIECNPVIVHGESAMGCRSWIWQPKSIRFT